MKRVLGRSSFALRCHAQTIREREREREKERERRQTENTNQKKLPKRDEKVRMHEQCISM